MTGVAPLRTVSHRFIIFNFCLIYDAILKNITAYGFEVWQVKKNSKSKFLCTEIGTWHQSLKFFLKIRNSVIREKMEFNNRLYPKEQIEIVWSCSKKA